MHIRWAPVPALGGTGGMRERAVSNTLTFLGNSSQCGFCSPGVLKRGTASVLPPFPGCLGPSAYPANAQIRAASTASKVTTNPSIVHHPQMGRFPMKLFTTLLEAGNLPVPNL